MLNFMRQRAQQQQKSKVAPEKHKLNIFGSIKLKIFARRMLLYIKSKSF